MRTLHIASLLGLVPAVLGAGSDDLASTLSGLIVSSVPLCEDNEYLVFQRGGLVCSQVVSNRPTLPDCKKLGQVLTYSNENGVAAYRCADKGTESLDPADISPIIQTFTRLQSFKTTVNNLMPSPPTRAVAFCGQYTNSLNPNAAITGNNGVTGVAGAANLCATVASCGPSARMCTVYDMYNSASSAAVPATLTQSWVHLSAWQHDAPGQVPTGNGLADNCVGWTLAANDLLFYGTTVEWKIAASGQRALHFASGPGLVSCNSRYPIACCR